MFEFIIGGFFGVYMAQSCVLPNLPEIVTNWVLTKKHTIKIPPNKENKEIKVGPHLPSFTGEMPKIPTEIEMTRLETNIDGSQAQE
jgi:hypothetical protein